LQRLSFEIADDERSATVEIDGVPRRDWRFFLVHPSVGGDVDFAKTEVLAVAFGPMSEATPSYKATFDAAELQALEGGYTEMEATVPHFVVLRARDLLQQLLSS